MPLTASRPVVERIADELFNRLDRLRVDGFGTFTASTSVVRPTRIEDYTVTDKQIVLTLGENIAIEELFRPGNPPAEAREQVFNIACHVIPSEKDTTPVEEYIAVIAADIRRVVCQPPATWHNFGGLAIDATWEAQERIESEGFDGVSVPIRVLYRTEEGNPYVSRA